MGVLRVIGGSVHAASSMVAENQDLFPSRPALALKTLPIALHAPHLETKTLAAGNSQRTPGMWTTPTTRPHMVDTEAGTDRKTEKCFLTHNKPTGRRAHPRAPSSTTKQTIRPPCNPEQPRPRTSPPTRQREPPAQCHRTEQHPVVYVPTRLPSGRFFLRQKQRTQARARASRLALGPCTARSYGQCAPALHTYEQDTSRIAVLHYRGRQPPAASSTRTPPSSTPRRLCAACCRSRVSERAQGRSRTGPLQPKTPARCGGVLDLAPPGGLRDD